MKLFDSELMMDMMDGNISEVKKIAQMLQSLGPQMIDDIEKAIDNEDWSFAGEAAHKLKTSLNLWQMDKLSDLCVSIENNGRDNINHVNIESNFVELKEGFILAIEQMKEEYSL
ncbi:MAG: Hpt domain-containing protein [Bacteroidales bacterium]|nr:Hpt domain-containing protein [Bacteroidales bacterium]